MSHVTCPAPALFLVVRFHVLLGSAFALPFVLVPPLGYARAASCLLLVVAGEKNDYNFPLWFHDFVVDLT